ncbi:MAG: hypothetical protein ACUVTL_05500 [Thermoproteota archaeon]
MGYRWRRMYYRTGMPGWMRFGYSPGWVGRSPTGLPPTAEWIISSGLMPQYQQYLSTGANQPIATPVGAPLTKEQEVQMLEQQTKVIEAQLEATRRRLEDLKKMSTTQQGTQPYYQYNPSISFGYIPSLYVAPSPEDELASLEEYRRELDEEVKGVEARIEELRKNLNKSKE